MRVLVAAILLLGGAGGLQAQVVQGVVRDVSNGAPIPAAEIVAVDARGRDVGRAVTDSLGLFRITVTSAGELGLRVSRIGYTTVDGSPLRVGNGEVVTVEVRMAVDAIPLDPLLVTARSTRTASPLDGFRARASGEGWGQFGEFLTREQIDRRARGPTSELLRAVPQITIVRIAPPGQPFQERHLLFVTRHITSGCQPTIYVDGVRVPQNVTATVDDYLDPDMLEGVEVYPSFPPPEFTGGECGTILFWKRPGGGSDRGFGWKRIAIGVGGLAAVMAFFVF